MSWLHCNARFVTALFVRDMAALPAVMQAWCLAFQISMPRCSTTAKLPSTCDVYGSPGIPTGWRRIWTITACIMCITWTVPSGQLKWATLPMYDYMQLYLGSYSSFLVAWLFAGHRLKNQEPSKLQWWTQLPEYTIGTTQVWWRMLLRLGARQR
jgi:hypothetical protein